MIGVEQEFIPYRDVMDPLDPESTELPRFGSLSGRDMVVCATAVESLPMRTVSIVTSATVVLSFMKNIKSNRLPAALTTNLTKLTIS